MSTDTIIMLATLLSAGIAGTALLLNVMNRGFDNVNRRFDDVNKRFDDVNRRFDDVNKRFDEVDRRFDDVNKRFDDVNKRFDDMNRRLDEHGTRLVRIEDGYIEIAQRASRLEARIGPYPTAAAPTAGEAAQPAGP